MLDYEVQKRLVRLLEGATSKGAPAVDADKLKEVKAIVRTSDDYIASAFDVLLERLKERHAQARLHAVRVCDELFMRSKSFRARLSLHFDDFLDLSVGWRPSKPLPPPTECAEALRAAALSAIQRWDAGFGLHYPQVSYGCRHLKQNLKLEMPRVNAPTPQERETEARRVRTQELLKEKYVAMQQEWGARVAKFHKLMSQLDGSLELLRTVRSAAVATETEGGEEHGEEFQWEEVEGEEGVSEGEEEEEEGLRGYAVVEDEDGAVGSTGDGRREEGGGGSLWRGPEEAAILETVGEIVHLLEDSHLPKFSTWLEVLTKVDLGARGENARRQQLLKEAVDLKAAAQAALQRCEGAGANRSGASGSGTRTGEGDGSAGQQVFEFNYTDLNGAELAGAQEAVGAQEEFESAEALLERQINAAATRVGRWGVGRGRGGRAVHGRSRGGGRDRGGATSTEGRAPAQAQADRLHNEACMSAAFAGLEGQLGGGREGAEVQDGTQQRGGKRKEGLTAQQRIAKKLKLKRRQ